MGFFSGNNDINFGKNELGASAVLVFLVWAKFFAVDFMVADILNWPMFGSFDWHTMRHSARALAVALPSLAAILCVVLPVSMFPAKFRGSALLAVDFLFSVLVLTDVLFIRYYSDIFIFHDIMLVPQTGIIAKSIWSLLKPADLLIFMDIPVTLVMFKKKYLRVGFNPLTPKRAALTVSLILLAWCMQGAAFLRLKDQRPNIIDAMYDRMSVCAWVSTASFHWGDVFTLLEKSMESDYVPPDKISEIKQWFAKHGAKKHRPPAAGKNLILIQCEALQYFVVDLKIGGVEVTPNLNRFRGECLYFTNAWNQTAGGLSSDSEFMANTGMFPSASGAVYTRFVDNTYNSLPKALKSKGYSPVVFQGTYSSFWNCHRMHPKLGFIRQYSHNTFADAEVIGLGLSDRVIFTKALGIMEKIKKPFYGFIVTLSGHHPFDFDGLDDGSLVLPASIKGTLVGNYLISMHYFDREFGRFIEGLRKDGLLDKTLVVVYGDHPAIPIAYKEDMERLTGKKIEDSIAWKETRRIPLMFRIPSKRGSLTGTYGIDTGQMDILPTVAGLMGLNIRTVFGKDLMDKDVTDPVIFRNGSYITDGVYVEPAIDKAVRLATREELPVSAYAAMTEEVKRRLGYNDIILEKNLIREILGH